MTSRSTSARRHGVPRRSAAQGRIDHAEVLDDRARLFQPLAYAANITFQPGLQSLKLRPVGIKPDATQADT